MQKRLGWIIVLAAFMLLAVILFLFCVFGKAIPAILLGTGIFIIMLIDLTQQTTTSCNRPLYGTTSV